MGLVFCTAIGVGGATVVGSLVGFIVKKIPKKFSDLTISLAAGIMLTAAVWGLIIPSMGEGTAGETVTSVIGVMFGALFIGWCERLIPHLRFVAGENGAGGEADGVLMLVLAMAVHNMPEGIAAGVSLGSGDISGAVGVAGGIALQNIPEGMAIIPPMLAVGMSKKRAFFLAFMTGLTEVAGTFLGYYAVMAFLEILPMSLAFAGGAMIYVIADEMIPYANAHGKVGAYVFAVGICVMLLAGIVL